MSNNDNKELIFQTRKIDSYLKNNPISLIFNAESARKQRKFDLAEEQYNKMLLSPDTKIVGLRGLLEYNLKNQDYHHALIYAEQIYNINYKLDWIYETIINIITQTRNWQKLIDINNDALYKKIISKKTKLNSEAIAKYEIALIKEKSSIREAIDLLSDANNLRPYFPPIVDKYCNFLIEDSQLSRAKKVIFKSWYVLPHQIYFNQILQICKIEGHNPSPIIKKLTNKNSNHYDSVVVNVKASIVEKNWDTAKETIKPILSGRPNKTVCELMSNIEIGISGNVQKANSWNNRASLGDPEKTWVCKQTGVSQEQWSSINHNGYFDCLEWTWPKDNQIDTKKRIRQLVPNIISNI